MFTLDSNTIESLRTLDISLDSLSINNIIDKNSINLLKSLSTKSTSNRISIILSNPSNNAKILKNSLINIVNNNDQSITNSNLIIEYILTIIYDGISTSINDSIFTKCIFDNDDNDSTFINLLIKLLTTPSNISTLSAHALITYKIDFNGLIDESLLINYINLLLVSNTQNQFIGLQLLKELLINKSIRDKFTLNIINDITSFKSFYNILINKSIELQMKYLIIYIIWCLSFNKNFIKLILINDNQFNQLIPILLNYSNDAIKEKIVRLSISTLLNFINFSNNDNKLIKKILLFNGLEIIKNLNLRKWSDNDLKDDLISLLEILQNSVNLLTNFDEYDNEINSMKLIWSPCHKNLNFWIDNLSKFKENNFKILKKLLLLIESDNINTDDKFQNQSIVCYDISMLIKTDNSMLDKILQLGFKNKIMALMNSPNANVKFEALKTLQLLVSMSL